MTDSTTKPNAELALNNPNQVNQDGPVECLGKTFENDTARRDYYLEILIEKLKDPEFRKIEGFPIGEDEDILKLSDPPYYTACPNPFLEDFINVYGRPYDPNEKYKREPYAADVSEGKNDPIYNAHSYHTKVPHKAIMRYILHYTEPGDIVFDGFCGTGMTGVAAQMCGNKESILSLGYQVKSDGTILQEVTDENSKKIWLPFSKLGARRAVLNDLSPAATFIAYNYNIPEDTFSDARLRAESAGTELFSSLKQIHNESLDIAKEKSEYGFNARRRAIERIGLPEVKNYRLAKLEQDINEWQQSFEQSKKVSPELSALLILSVSPTFDMDSNNG